MANGSFVEWALWYAREREWPVFPVKPMQKAPPLVKNGLLDASLDELKIKAWWKQWPDANIAVRTGVWGWVLDKDPGGGETWDRLILAHGRPRDTLTAITPRDGRHLYYLEPEQAAIPTRAPVRDDWPGLDVRGQGGYVLVHPSVVLVDGKRKRYQWDGARGENDEIAAPDPWLIEAILRPNGTNGRRPPLELPEKLRHADKQRHPFLFKYGAKLRGDGFEFGEIFAALLSVNAARCEPPYDVPHIEKLAADICQRYERGRRPQHQDVPPGPQHEPPPQREEPVYPKRLSVSQVKALNVPPPSILIEGLLPGRGLTLFTGGQKMGKTILAAQSAIAVATGAPLLDYYRVEKQGPVLIVETDDPAGDASFKDLWVKWDVPDATPAYLQISSPFALGEEFIAWVESEIEEVKPVLVVLDSYLSLRPMRGKSSDIVHAEKQEIAQLDAMAKRRNVLIILLHHESTTTKASAQLDWDSRGAGTFAITAAAESQLAIARFRDLDGSNARLVRAKGRHLAERQMTVSYDAKLGSFTHILDGLVAPYYPLIVEMRRNIEAAVFTAADIIERLGVSRATAFRHLAALTNAGAVLRGLNEYRFAPDIARMPL